MTYVLDASALVRFLEGDASARRIKEVFADATSGKCKVSISSVNWGEVIGVIAKRQGKAAAEGLRGDLAIYGLEIISVTAERAFRSAYIKLDIKIPYANSFAVELASAPEHILITITADFDFKPAAQSISIEFLPAKSKP